MRALSRVVAMSLTGLFFAVFAHAQISPAVNKISVDVSTQPQNSQFSYDSCFAIGKTLGMTQCGLFINWTTLETAPLTYNFALLDIANAYYPAKGISIDLNLNPINTNRLEVPSDLFSNSPAFGSQPFINRYKSLLDSTKKHIPQLMLSSLVIGSEIDAYLGTSATLWTQYEAFYVAVSTYAKTLWPGLHVAAELTYNGIIAQNSLAQQLNAYSDYIGVSYYPLNDDFTVKPVSTVPSDVGALVNLYPSTPICFYQYGYPSGAMCNSSEDQQALFIRQTFQTWDVYSSHILMVDFTWLHDLDSAVVAKDAAYYGITSNVFSQYLRTLGLRTWSGIGADKPALNELRCQANQRGYNSLIVACPERVINAAHGHTVPATHISMCRISCNRIRLELPSEMQNAQVAIYNSRGETMSTQIGKDLVVELSSLANGVVFVSVRSGNNQNRNHCIIGKQVIK